MRKDLKAKKWIDALGAVMSLVGLGGMAGAAEGQGRRAPDALQAGCGPGPDRCRSVRGEDRSLPEGL